MLLSISDAFEREARTAFGSWQPATPHFVDSGGLSLRDVSQKPGWTAIIELGATDAEGVRFREKPTLVSCCELRFAVGLLERES